jgi:hypothetical protein
MSVERSTPSRKAWAILVGASLCAWIFLCQSAAFGQFSSPGGGGGGGRHGSGGKNRDAPDPGPAYKPLPAQAILTPHGGEYLSTEKNYYEIVYMPLQTRIYLYDGKLKPLSAREVHAQMIVQLPTENAPRAIPLQYVSPPPGVSEQDYVVALVDLRALQEKETSIRFEFNGLPDNHDPTASFTPYYSHFIIRPYVCKVLPTEADREGMARQRVCPVSGAPLGSRGPVVKLYVADIPLYVSADDCAAAVKEAPEKFLPRYPLPGRGP